MDWSLVFIFYKSLTLEHLERSLFSLAKQTVKPNQIVFYDQNSGYNNADVNKIISCYFDIKPMDRYYVHNLKPKASMTYLGNCAIRAAHYDTFIFCRSDCIFDPEFCEQLLLNYDTDALNFVSSWIYAMGYYSKRSHDKVNHGTDLESLRWRMNVQNLLKNRKHSQIMKDTSADACCFCTSKQAMAKAQWYDENLTEWGCVQMSLQRAMLRAGVKFTVVSKPLCFHMNHQLSENLDPKAIDGGRSVFAATAIERWKNSPQSSF